MEAEWEYGYRAGTTTAFYNAAWTESSVNSDPNLGEIAWYRFTSNGFTREVMGKLPNPWGLYDMSGNVAEWVWDVYGDYPVVATDPRGPVVAASPEMRVIRGGSWESLAINNRASSRNAATAGANRNTTGLRLARTAGL